MYCGNNPIIFVDFSGNISVPIWEVIIGIIKDIFVGFGGAFIEAGMKLFAQSANIPLYLLDDVGGAILNPTSMQALSKATNLQYAGTIMKTVGKIAKIAGYVLLAIDCGLSIYNNFTNPNLTMSRKITDSIVDVGFSVGSFFTAMVVGTKIGAWVGTFFGPGIGTLAGAAIGAVIGLGIYFFQQTQIYQDIKIGVNDFFVQTIPNAWNSFVNNWNDFWSFNWAR